MAHLQEVVLASKEQKGAVRLVPFLIKIVEKPLRTGFQKSVRKKVVPRASWAPKWGPVADPKSRKTFLGPPPGGVSKTDAGL